MLARTNLVALIGRHVDLKKAGTLFKGLCPFHDEKTPSFTVSPTRNTYHCFGCGAHGDAIKFLMEHGARNFPEAVRELAAECGVEVPETRPESPEQKAERQARKTLERRLLDAQDALTGWYSEQLFGPAGHRARNYLQNRGMTVEGARAFRLGFASNDRRAFATFVEERSIELDDLAQLGVLLPPDDGWNRTDPLGGGYMRFRDRLMFPVVDFRGDVTGFSARILDNNKKTAKYINSPETPVFVKGDQLYGAFTARSEARKAGRVVICEGNVDVIALWESGFKGSVAAMGTALTITQARLVKRLDENVVCVMDGDAAGAKAAFASLEPFLELGVQPRAVMLPAGEDPDSYIRRNGPDAFGRLLDDAPPLLDLLIERAHDDHPNDPPGRIAAVRSVAPVLAKIDDQLTLDLYRQKVHQLFGLTMDIIDRALAEPSQKEERPKGRPQPHVSTPREPVHASNSRFDGPPPPEFEPMWADSVPPTGFAGFDGAGNMAPKRASFKAPGYIAQLFEILLQYPALVVELHAREGHKLLTNAGLAGFVLSLYREVSADRTPNVDRLLVELGQPEVVTFLRLCQTRTTLIDEESAQQAFSESLLRLERGSLEIRREELKRDLYSSFKSDPDRCELLREELDSVQKRLRNLHLSTGEGAH